MKKKDPSSQANLGYLVRRLCRDFTDRRWKETADVALDYSTSDIPALVLTNSVLMQLRTVYGDPALRPHLKRIAMLDYVLQEIQLVRERSRRRLSDQYIDIINAILGRRIDEDGNAGFEAKIEEALKDLQSAVASVSYKPCSTNASSTGA